MAYNEVKYEDRFEFKVSCRVNEWGQQQALVHAKVFNNNSAPLVRMVGEDFKIVQADDVHLRNKYRKRGHKYIDTVITKRDPKTGTRIEWDIWFETADKGMW